MDRLRIGAPQTMKTAPFKKNRGPHAAAVMDRTFLNIEYITGHIVQQVITSSKNEKILLL